MINKYCEGVIPTNISVRTEFDDSLEETIKAQIAKIEDAMDSYHVSNALVELWAIISRANKYVDETEPWKLAKSELEEDKEKLKSVMFHLAETLRKIAILLTPFMPEKSSEILKQLNLPAENKEWNLVYSDNEILENTKVIEKGEPLFARLDREEEIEYIKSNMK